MDQDLTVGGVINGAFATVMENKEAALIFVGVFTLLGTSLEWGLAQIGGGLLDQFAGTEWLAWFGLGAGLGGILFVIIAVIGQYILWEAMLRRHHQLAAGYNRRFIAFVGLAILTGLGASLGFLLLIVPGLIFSARWAMAPAHLIVEKRGIIDSMGDSWDEVRGNTTPVALTILITIILAVGVSFSLGAYAVANPDPTQAAQVGLIGSLVGQFVSQLVTVFQIGLGVFLFDKLHSSSEALSDVFE
jgi:hypothetical protein